MFVRHSLVQGTNLRLLREQNLGLAARGILRKDLLRYRDLKDLGGKTDGENLTETHKHKQGPRKKG